MDEKPKRKVGWKSPPEERQFKKGEPSPNPGGRPRKDRSFQKMVVDELNRKVAVTVNGRRKLKTVGELALQQLGNKAAAGNLAAYKEFTKLQQKVAPLKPQTEMSEEELRFRKEASARLVDATILGLEMMAAANKPERPRKPPPDGSDGNDH